MGIYSIKDLEELSGIKAHTLRIWEQRYNILEPIRTETNIRTYQDHDLRRILNVSLLNNEGYKISKISQMSDEEINHTIINLDSESAVEENYINAFISATLELNQFAFEKTLNDAQAQFGFENAFIKVVFPFLEKTGILWQTSNICSAHEHYASNIIRQKIISQTDYLHKQYIDGCKTFLLFLPEGELHELALLFCNYIIKSRGHRTVYLGQTVPLNDLILLNSTLKADIIISSFTNYPTSDTIENYCNALAYNFSESEIYIAGKKMNGIKLSSKSNLNILNNFSQLINYIEKT